MEVTTKVTTNVVKTFVVERLSTNDAWAVKALVRLYDFQTREEQRIECAIQRNYSGFNKPDSRILSSFAKQYLRKGWLSEKQLWVLKQRIPKYWKQIIEISNWKQLLQQMEMEMEIQN